MTPPSLAWTRLEVGEDADGTMRLLVNGRRVEAHSFHMALVHLSFQVFEAEIAGNVEPVDPRLSPTEPHVVATPEFSDGEMHWPGKSSGW